MIIPAIIPTSLVHLKETLDRLKFAKTIQIDVVDGLFVPTHSWPYDPAGNPALIADELEQFEVEVDLMVQNPLSAIKPWKEAGAKRLVFHLESLKDPSVALHMCKEIKIQCGFSLNNDTPLNQLYNYLDDLDFVQLMGIAHIGRQAEPFDNRVIERIATLRALFPNLEISVDGSVNQDTLKSLAQAGANRFISGSAILKADNPETAYNQLLKIVE